MTTRKGQGGRPLGSTTRRGGAPKKPATPKKPAQQRTPAATSKKKGNWLTKDNNSNLKKVLGAAENIAALGAGNPPSASVNGASNGAKNLSNGSGDNEKGANDNSRDYNKPDKPDFGGFGG